MGHSAYELRDEQGKIRGEFNKKQLKRYKEELHTKTEGDAMLLGKERKEKGIMK